MNARQVKKHLKKQINRLKSDNNLMRRIIMNSPSMQELYYLYKKPVNVIDSTISFQEFRTKRSIPVDMVNADRIIEYTKQELAKDLFESIKDNIIYKVDNEFMTSTITASIFIGKSED